MTRYTDVDTGNNLLDEAIENYLIHGYMPGGFLTSVLANDLYMAVGRADHWNKDRLPQIVNEVLYKMPSISWGSYAAVNDWCKDKDGRRSYYRDQKEKELVMRILKGETVGKTFSDPPF